MPESGHYLTLRIDPDLCNQVAKHIPEGYKSTAIRGILKLLIRLFRSSHRREVAHCLRRFGDDFALKLPDYLWEEVTC